MYYTVKRLIDSLVPLFKSTVIDLKAPGWQNQPIHLAMLGRGPMTQREPSPFTPPEQRALDWLDKRRYQDVIFMDMKKDIWNVGIQIVLELRGINLRPENFFGPHDRDLRK